MRSYIVLLVAIVLAGCSSVSVEDYGDRQPALVPEQFFDGPMTAHGVIKNRSGRVLRSFNVTIDAYWRDGVGTLEEDFIFDNGDTDRRVWTLTPQADGSYLGTAGDVVGDGRVTVAGNSMFLDYVLRIPWGDDDGSLDLRIDDRMYLVHPDVLVNESRMIKFGFDVGEILLVILRQPVSG